MSGAPRDHCGVCTVVRELTIERDRSHENGQRYWALNWALVIARSVCPENRSADAIGGKGA